MVPRDLGAPIAFPPVSFLALLLLTKHKMDRRLLYAQIVYGVVPETLQPMWVSGEEPLNPLPRKTKNVHLNREVYTVRAIDNDRYLDIFFRGEFPIMGQLKQKRVKFCQEPLKIEVIKTEQEIEEERHERRVKKGKQLREFGDKGYLWVSPKSKI